jgi:hypothetical protein
MGAGAATVIHITVGPVSVRHPLDDLRIVSRISPGVIMALVVQFEETDEPGPTDRVAV